MSDFFEFFILGQGGAGLRSEAVDKVAGVFVPTGAELVRHRGARAYIASAYIKRQVALAGGERLLLLPGACPPGSFRKGGLWIKNRSVTDLSPNMLDTPGRTA
ncbi:hypothetical protein BMJ32_06915 [Sinorhizobium medicae]|nr:hypothetical protein BMJ32_06915 [Sinorhizobium medicae]